MTDESNSNLEHHQQVAPTSQQAELVAFADCELVAINNAMMLVINRVNGNQQIMSPQVVEGLKTCTTFDTLEGHAAHLARTRPELNGNHEMAVTVLSNLNAAGMLLQAGDIIAKLDQPAPRQLPPTRAFIITCDRPAAVERLLDSMLRAGKLSQHDALFLVDDSREPASRAANQETVAKFNFRSAKEMFYVGAETQAALLSGLISALPEHEAGIRFLLDSTRWQGKKTYGRSRNLCLLLSVGYRALLMDDDILCRAVLPPLTQSGVSIGSGAMRKSACFQTQQELLGSGATAPFDPLSGHASLLGSNFGEALRALNNGPLQLSQLDNTNAALMNVLEVDSPVLVTQCGSLGDTGTGGTRWAMYQDAGSVERMLAAPQGMKQALENGLHWLGSDRPCFFKMPFMSQLTGLDNSHLLPPYFPAFRGEDALFGAMLTAMHRDSVALEYPWSVPHLPLEERTHSFDDPVNAGGGISLFARYLTEHIDYKDSNDPQRNLQTLARDALRMAARSDKNLLLDYRSELGRGHSDLLHTLQSQYAASQQLPSLEWQNYLKNSVEEVQKALATAQSPTAIKGAPSGATEQELLAEFRDMARGFAAAMLGWIEMRSVACGLSDELIRSRKMLPR